jgi:hypothetical protein
MDCHVIVHIHFADPFDHVKDQNHQQQNTSIVTAVNLRHYQSEPTEGKTGCYESMFRNKYLEGKGFLIRKFEKRWKWKDPCTKDAINQRIQCLQPPNMGNLPQYRDGDPRLELHQVLSCSSHSSTSRHLNPPAECDKDDLALVINLMEVIEEMSRKVSVMTKSAIKDNHAFNGIKVLAFGNNNYSLLGLDDNGKLKNSIGDAQSVVGAFSKLGAHVQLELDIKDVPDLSQVVDYWAASRLTSDVCVAFVFWAGHAFQNMKDGSTHLVPTGNNWDIKQLKPVRHTFSVTELIEAVRDKSQSSKLIVCLDSCRTELGGSKEWHSIQHGEKGTDSKSYEGVEIWYSTSHGAVAQDGVTNHSPFAQSLLNCLGRNLKNKTFEAIWKDISKEMKELNHQVPSRYTNGYCEHETLLPVVPEETVASNADLVSILYRC